jgi:hypothetical protein
MLSTIPCLKWRHPLPSSSTNCSGYMSVPGVMTSLLIRHRVGSNSIILYSSLSIQQAHIAPQQIHSPESLVGSSMQEDTTWSKSMNETSSKLKISIKSILIHQITVVNSHLPSQSYLLYPFQPHSSPQLSSRP